MQMNIEPPWQMYRKKLNALFSQDPEIEVGELSEDASGYTMTVVVSNAEKLTALSQVLPRSVAFGNVTLDIRVRESEEMHGLDPYRTLFTGNPIVKDFRTVTDLTGTEHGFVRFWPEVIQFFHDDLSDYNGNWSGLAQDIAREVFQGDFYGVHFCTADIRENGDEPAEPLGEWP